MRLQWKTKRVGPGDYVMLADGVPVVSVGRESEGSGWTTNYLDSLFQLNWMDPEYFESKRDAVEAVISDTLPVYLYGVPSDLSYNGLSRYLRWQIVSRIGEVFPSLRWDADPTPKMSRIREIFPIGSSAMSPADRLRQDMEKYGYDRGDDRDLDVQVVVRGYVGEPDALTDEDAELWAFSEQAEELEQAFNLDVQLRTMNV